MFTSAEVAKNVIGIGKTKASMSAGRLFVLGILAGMFIALASAGATTVNGFMTHPGAARMLAACVFPAGLAMVLVAGSELFTGNCLITVAVLSGEVRFSQMLRNWFFVYIGNFVGAMIVVLIVVYSGQLDANGGALAVAAVKTAAAKCSLSQAAAVTSQPEPRGKASRRTDPGARRSRPPPLPPCITLPQGMRTATAPAVTTSTTLPNCAVR